MRPINIIITVLALILYPIINSEQVFAQEDLSSEIKDPELEQEFKWLKAETYVFTASRVMESIKKTPSVVSVVTDKQIRQMGARTLMDVLNAVPGFSYRYTQYGQYEIDPGCGSGVMNMPNVRIMVNNHTVNEAFTGGASAIYNNVIVDNVKRIEFLGSAGSALWGSNAKIIVNIITKESQDINGFELTAGAGTYDTYQYNLLFGKTFRDIELTFNINRFNTHGFEGFVEQDWQSYWDTVFGTNASLTPGRMDTDEEKYDASLTVKYKGLKLDGRYIDKNNDFHLSTYGLLAEKSPRSRRDYFVNLSYERNIWEGFDLFAKVYRNYNRSTDHFSFFNPGAVVPTLGGVPQFVPEGVFSISSVESSRTGIELQGTFNFSDFNTFVVGAAYEKQKAYDWERTSNFTFRDGVEFNLAPLMTYHIPSKSKNFKAIYIEDIWDITNDLRFVGSVRYDRYSDFGGETSYMAGLKWLFAEGFDLKLHYSTGFRVPSFFDIYYYDGIKRDIVTGTLELFEMSLGAEFSSSLSGRATLYRREGEDAIGPDMNGQIANLDNVLADGIKVEIKYDLGRGSYLAMNYTYESLDDMEADDQEFRSFTNPTHKGNIITNFRLSRYLNLYADCHFEDGYKRNYNDTRDDMSGFGVVNTTLIAKKFLKDFEGFELRLSVYNLFDKEYTYPWLEFMTNDLPQPCRNYFAEIKYIF